MSVSENPWADLKKTLVLSMIPDENELKDDILSVDVVAEVVLGHREDGDVGQGADVRKLLKLVLDKIRVDAAPKNLGKSIFKKS